MASKYTKQTGIYAPDGTLEAILTETDYSAIPDPVRICKYCDSEVTASTLVCPSCGAREFEYKCPACKNVFEGGLCPTCKEKADAQTARAARKTAETADRLKANQGLVWKTLLTLFLPFVGAYFLLAPQTRLPYKIFGYAWCIILGAYILIDPEGPMSTNVTAAVLCFLPVVVGAFRELQFRGKLPWSKR